MTAIPNPNGAARPLIPEILPTRARGRGVADITPTEESLIIGWYNQCKPRPWIAQQLGLSVPTLQRKIVDLVEAGRLERIPPHEYRARSKEEAAAEPPAANGLTTGACTHYWLCGMERIAQVFPHFVERYGEAPRGSEWHVCWRCRELRLVERFDPITLVDRPAGAFSPEGKLDMAPLQAAPPPPALLTQNSAEQPQDVPQPAERPDAPEPEEAPVATPQERKAAGVEANPFVRALEEISGVAGEQSDPGDEHVSLPDEYYVSDRKLAEQRRDARLMMHPESTTAAPAPSGMVSLKEYNARLTTELITADRRAARLARERDMALQEASRLREQNATLQRKVDLTEALCKHLEKRTAERIADLERRLEVATLRVQVYELREENERLKAQASRPTGMVICINGVPVHRKLETE